MSISGGYSDTPSVGGLVGVLSGGKIENCYTSINIDVNLSESPRNNGCGGIVGGACGTISNCYSSSTLTAYKINAGGIVGTDEAYGSGNDLIISNCQFSGILEGTSYSATIAVGGVIGCISD